MCPVMSFYQACLYWHFCLNHQSPFLLTVLFHQKNFPVYMCIPLITLQIHLSLLQLSSHRKILSFGKLNCSSFVSTKSLKSCRRSHFMSQFSKLKDSKQLLWYAVKAMWSSQQIKYHVWGVYARLIFYLYIYVILLTALFRN